MDWIHCNECHVQPRTNSNPPKFFLTSCGHIFCERCNQNASTNKCRVCQVPHTTTMLSSELREEIRDFFADPDTLLSKCSKVIQYQKSQRERLMAHLRRTQAKYEAAKKEILKKHEEMKALQKKTYAAIQENAWYKKQWDRMRNSRAAPVAPPSPSGSIVSNSPFASLSSSDTQRGALQKNSGMGNSRISMGFTSSTPRHPQDLASPLSVSMLPPTTPFNPNQYRSRHFVTPESTPGGAPSFMNSPSTSESDYRRSQQMRRQQQSPPSRGTPTDALKILSLAYKKNP